MKHSPGRRLFDWVLLFLCAIVFLRAITVEPFGVPTGSMATTFLGNHRQADCPRCGFPVRLGDHATEAEACCPNCGKQGITFDADSAVPGDRLMVNKTVFDFRDPRRWEVAVFIRDAEPEKPYVKRVAGLPGEAILLRDGDVYIDGGMARKSMADCRSVMQLVWDQCYVPAGEGWTKRWLREYPEPRPEGEVFGIAETTGATLKLNSLDLGVGTVQWVAYRHRDLDADEDRVIRGELKYNGACHRFAGLPVHDFLVECEFTLTAGSGVFGARLTDGDEMVTLLLDTAEGSATLIREPGEVLRTATGIEIRPNEASRLRFSFFDRRAMAELDGEALFEPADLPPAEDRQGVSKPFEFGAAGAAFEVTGVRLYRDLYHTASGRHAVKEPLRLGANEYFMLGDNSTNSDDSRRWDDPVARRDRFLGKPFLLHQPSRLADWELFGEPRRSRVLDWDRIRWVR